MLLRVVEAHLEARALLVAADVQVELHDAGGVGGEMRLEGVDALVSVLPDLLGHELLDPDHEHVLVVRPVEDTDAALAGSRGVHSPQEVVAQLLLGRHPESGHARALRVEGGHHLADQAVLAARVERLEHDQQRLALLGPQLLLERSELVAQLLEARARRILVAVEARRAPRVDRRKVGPRSRRDAKELAEGHGGFTAAR